MRLAKVQMFDWHHHGQNPYSRLTTRPQISDKQIQVCQEWLADHYCDADPVVEMIRQSGLSRRTFGRRFHTATGHAPLDYVQRVRIEEAKQLLETDARTIEQIADEVGYSDTVSFRRLFKRMVGETPTAYQAAAIGFRDSPRNFAAVPASGAGGGEFGDPNLTWGEGLLYPPRH